MYSDRRRCPLKDDEKQLFEEALVELVDNFSDSWLTSYSGHPLQTLWNRKDILASIELYYLGRSIQKIKNISPDQLNQNIKLLKSNDRGTMAGAVWEIILTSAFHKPPEQRAKLLGPRKPTYDIEVETVNGFKNRISVKNFGQSKKDMEFLGQFEVIDKIIENSAINHIQMIIIRKSQFPSKQEWDQLKRIVLKLVKHQIFSNWSIDGWYIAIRPLTYDQIKARIGLDQATLYSKKASYVLFMALPFYKNEDKNIESNLNAACSDLIEKGAIESNKSMNSLFIHLPEYVSLNDYATWCERFYINNPTAPISYITLFQPAYATDIDKDESFLAFNCKVISRPNRPESTNKLLIEIPIGKIANEFKHLFGQDSEIPKHHYIKQSGHIHIDCGDLTHGGMMKTRFDYGILTDAIGELNGEQFWIAGNFPPTTRLILL